MSKYIYCSSPARAYIPALSCSFSSCRLRCVSYLFVTLSYGYYPLVYPSSSMLQRGPRRVAHFLFLLLSLTLSSLLAFLRLRLLSPVRVPRASIHRTRAYSGTHPYFNSSNQRNGSDINILARNKVNGMNGLSMKCLTDKSNYTV
jgi:hypothetical protein